MRVGGRGGEVPVREGAAIAAGTLEVVLVDPKEVSVPGEEEGVEVHILGAVDVDGSVVHVAVHGGRVLDWVKVGWLTLQALHRVGVSFSLLGSHAVEVDSRLDVVGRAPPVTPTTDSMVCRCG